MAVYIISRHIHALFIYKHKRRGFIKVVIAGFIIYLSNYIHIACVYQMFSTKALKIAQFSHIYFDSALRLLGAVG